MAQVHQDKGTLGFAIYHEHPDWWSNNNGYNFGPYYVGPFTVKCTKTSDLILHIKVQPLFERTVSFEAAIDNRYVKDNLIRAHINWNKPEINLFLNAILAQTLNL